MLKRALARGSRSMSELEIIQARVRERLQTLGISGNQASRRAGRGTSYVNDLLSGESKSPKMEHLGLLAEALDCDLSYLIGKQETPRTGEVVEMPVRDALPDDPRSVPWFSVSLADSDGFFAMTEAEAASAPLPLEGAPRIYAVSVPDALMSPRYDVGDVVYVNPRLPVGPGAYVVLRLNDDRAVIRQVVEISSNEITVRSLADEKIVQFPRSDVKSVHRIAATVQA